MKTFPTSGDYTIKSNPIIVVVHNGEREVVTLDAELMLKTGEAYAKEGKRRVDLQIHDWVAKGPSNLLQTDLVLRMQHDAGAATIDRPSFVESQQKEADFPATAQFVLPY